MEPMADDEIDRAVQDVDWTREGDRIAKQVDVDDFEQALEFVNAVGRIAEEQVHHPDIHIEDYNRVRLEVTTHDAGGLTQRDFKLARAVDDLEV